jgi:hypothetical protein
LSGWVSCAYRCAVPKSPANPRQLLLVKQLFDEAKRYAAVGGRLASMKALLLLDLSVEQMLNAVISDFSSEELLNLDDANWQTLWTKASAAAKNGELARLPNSRPLQKLHKLRNCVVHHGERRRSGSIALVVANTPNTLVS